MAIPTTANELKKQVNNYITEKFVVVLTIDYRIFFFFLQRVHKKGNIL